MLPEPLPVPEPGATPLDGAGQETAWEWFETEREVVMALVRRAAADARYGLPWLLVVGLWPYFERSGRALDWAATAEVALTALEPTIAEAAASGDRLLLGAALASRATSCAALGRLDEALELAERARVEQAAVENDWGTAHASVVVGQVHAARKETAEAVAAWREAHSESERVRTNAVVQGRPREAVTHYRREASHALTTQVLTMIGDLLAEAGDRAGAERAWREALDLSAHGQTATTQDLLDRLERGTA